MFLVNLKVLIHIIYKRHMNFKPFQNVLVICLLLSLSILSVTSTSMEWAKYRFWKIVTLHGEGLTERDVAVKLLSSKTTVLDAVAKFNADGTFHDTKRSGRPTFKNSVVVFWLQLIHSGL